MKLSEILKKEMKKRNLSITSLASLTSVPKTNISGWLEGSYPRIDQLQKVADGLSLSIEYLAFGKESKTLVEELVEKFEVHNGLYEVSIKKITKKNET